MQFVDWELKQTSLTNLMQKNRLKHKRKTVDALLRNWIGQLLAVCTQTAFATTMHQLALLCKTNNSHKNCKEQQIST